MLNDIYIVITDQYGASALELREKVDSIEFRKLSNEPYALKRLVDEAALGIKVGKELIGKWYNSAYMECEHVFVECDCENKTIIQGLDGFGPVGLDLVYMHCTKCNFHQNRRVDQR